MPSARCRSVAMPWPAADSRSGTRLWWMTLLAAPCSSDWLRLDTTSTLQHARSRDVLVPFSSTSEMRRSGATMWLAMTVFFFFCFSALPNRQAGPGLRWRQSSVLSLVFIFTYLMSLHFIQSSIVALCLPQPLLTSILLSKIVRRRKSHLKTWSNQFSVFVE